jgi:AAA15 family ATPase/GTPase
MRLQSLNYFEYENKPNAWSLEGMVFDNINLVVGKNATGKTNTIAKIAWLGKILAGEQLPENANYDIEFSDNNSIYRCKLNISNHKMQFESDCIEKAKLAQWAEGLRMYAFSKFGREINPQNANSGPGLYINGEREFGTIFKERIIDSMKEIGYELTNISTDNSMLYINEKNCDADISQYQMSQGMLRALSLIIQITYNALKNLPSTILIDDIGEGLDFERSASIIQLISRVASEGKCQLIMSTNDRYVMNNIPLKYWQVIQRTGGCCKAFNHNNSKEIFEKFAYTGLNNFDFLATDFINSGFDE